MAAAAELPKPGVEVIQQLRTVTPQIVAPTLAPCVIGVCKQIVEVLESDGTLNSDALVSAPAVATSPNAQASFNLNGDTLVVSVNDGPDQTFTFAGTDPLTATSVAAQINGATTPPSGFAAYAVNLGTLASPDWRLQLRTVGSGASQKLRLVGGTALSDLGWGSRVGWTFYGLGAYANYAEYIPQASFPDPRGIIDELDIDEDTIRVFVDLGTEVREILRSETFLRKGAEATPVAVTPFNDNDGDTTTPYVSLTNATVAPNLLATATQALTGVGTVDLSADVLAHNQTLTLAIDGSHPQTLVLIGQPIVSLDTGSFTWTNIQSNDLVVNVNGTDVTVTFSAGVADIATAIAEINAAVALALGAGTVVAYRAGSWGEESGVGTYIGFFYGGAPSTNVVPNTSVKTEDSTGGSTAACVTEFFGSDVDQEQWNRFDKQNALQPIGGFNDQIDALWGGNVAWVDGSNYLYIQSTSIGSESSIWVDSNSSALTALGFALQTGWFYGTAFPTRVGDALYADGAFLGNIIEVHSQGQAGRVKLDSEVALTFTASTWYIVAKHLDTVDSAQYGVTVATPDLVIDTVGAIVLKHHFLRDTTGTIISSTSAVNLYVMYEALRLDVTADAADPGLLAFDDVDDLDEALGPLVPENPLAYGLYICMQNAQAVRVYGIGVGEYSDDKPYGTVEAWTAAYDFLETHGVYGLAPMTDDLESHLVCRTHVLAMSEPEEKGERIAHFYLGRPTRSADDLVVSGNDGDRISTGPEVFDTKAPTLSQALLALGIDPSSITVADGVYIDVSDDAYNWNVTGSVVNGTQLTINTTFVGDENIDSFYATGTFPAAISTSFSVKVRGAVISNDTDEEIATIIARGEAFASRRMRMVQCDQLKATVNSVEQLIPGFFMCAAKVGQIAGNPPSTPYTNFPITGFTGVTGTNKIYKQSQMNQGAAGGAEWFVQESDGIPVTSRHQVTTDLTSVETTEQSITNALDYCAIFMRTGLRNFIGRYNISDTFLDTLASVVQGQLQWLMDHKVIAGGDLNNIIQDESNPTRVLIDCTIQPFYPCNYIRLTLVV